MREFSVPPVTLIGDAANLTDPVWDNATVAPEAVQFVDRGREITCAEFRDQVVAQARGLLASGIEPGDRVGLLSRTRYEWTLVDYAIWAAGAVTVPIYETSSAEQIAWILGDSGAVACFVEGQQAVESPRVWRIDEDLEGLRKQGEAVTEEELEQKRRSVRADDIATLIYTSGTTGRPKGCVLTHRNLLSDIANAVPGLPNLFREGASTMLFLPLAHSFARLIQLGVVQTRTRMGYTSDVKNLSAELQAFRPTFLLSVPRVFEKVYNTARQRAHADGKGAIFDRAERVAVEYSEADGQAGAVLRARHALFERLVYRRLRAALGGRCTAAISGGAPLGVRLAHFFRGIGLTVFEGYGLTETSPAVAVNLEHNIRIGTVGRPLPGVTVRTDDEGEILIRGDLVFRGYWGDPTPVVDEDGWFHSGDIGELDDDGFLRITGRKKEIIVTAGGKNVAPAVLEDRLRAHPLVSQCLVVGDRQPFVAVLVTLDEDAWTDWLAAHGRPAGTGVDDPDLHAEIQGAVDEANKAVSKAEAIKVFRILPEDFTETNGLLTPSLKVKRNLVMKEYADEIAGIYRG